MISRWRQSLLSQEHGEYDALEAGTGFGAAKTVDGVVIYSARASVTGAKAAIFTSSTCPLSARAVTVESMGSRARTGAPIWSASSCAWLGPNSSNASPQWGHVTIAMFSTMPRIGLCICFARPAAFSTIMLDSSCGVVTMRMPSTGRDWNAVRGTSAVPGGRSTMRTSKSPHATSVQNCLMADVSSGPRQMTGWLESSKSRFMEMILIPVAVSGGTMPTIEDSGRTVRPNRRGMDGPVMSASRMPTFGPRGAARTAAMADTRDLPTPPLPLATASTCRTWLTCEVMFCSFSAVVMFFSFVVAAAQLSGHVHEASCPVRLNNLVQVDHIG